MKSDIKTYKTRKDFIRLAEEIIGDMEQVKINRPNFDEVKFIKYIIKRLNINF